MDPGRCWSAPIHRFGCGKIQQRAYESKAYARARQPARSALGRRARVNGACTLGKMFCSVEKGFALAAIGVMRVRLRAVRTDADRHDRGTGLSL